MLGTILAALTNPALAEEALGEIGDQALLERVRGAAAAAGLDVGPFVASTVRQTLDHAEETVWLNLIGRMSNAERPGVAALQGVLARSFPAPPTPRHQTRRA
ncbi:MAG TPA: hypothetical protein VL154_13775 [Acetobacteraceae bacterium]|jgi:hypothetical protein|nr:hypothetical protein [Acetobacteraceae bacterium]